MAAAMKLDVEQHGTVGRADVMAVMERLRGAEGFAFERSPAPLLSPTDPSDAKVHEFRLLCPHLAVLCWLQITFSVPGVHVPGEPVPSSPLGGIGGFSPTGKLCSINGSFVAHPDYPIRPFACDENSERHLGCAAHRLPSARRGWRAFNNQVLDGFERAAAEFARLNPSLFAKGGR